MDAPVNQSSFLLKLAERGGKNAKKRAIVAVARKLTVLLHRLCVSGEVYEPLRNNHKVVSAVAARREACRLGDTVFSRIPNWVGRSFMFAMTLWLRLRNRVQLTANGHRAYLSTVEIPLNLSKPIRVVSFSNDIKIEALYAVD